MTGQQDDLFMARALELARQGRGLVSPNPMVGALLVKEGMVIAEAFHCYDEKKHAEVWAVEAAGEKARGAILYVNLEPCAHYGRTPPCVSRVIESGIIQVVAAMEDPNPLVSGKGFRQLKEAGIDLRVGTGKEEALQLNEAYSKYIRVRKPWAILKAAMTLDGKIAQSNGYSHWISSELSRGRAQQLRFECDALLTGIGTILRDDPLLTERTGQARRRPLLRCVLDSRLRLPLASRLVQTRKEGGIIAFCSPERDPTRQRLLEKIGVEVVVIPEERKQLSLDSVLEELGRREITSLLIEAGPAVNFSACQQGIVDKVCCFIAPRILGGVTPLPFLGEPGFINLADGLELRFSSIERVGSDILVEAYVRR